MGLDVGVIERRRFPRSHVGICIADETVALIDYLGLGHEFSSARFWRRNLTAVRWGDSETRLVPQKGYHVDRAVFDQLLLCRSRSAGVTVYQPAQVLEIESLKDSDWRVTITFNDGRQLLKGRFIVDAAGRRAAIRGARVKDSPPLVSLHANWTLQAVPELDGLIESGEDAWLWYAQTASDRAVVSVFSDPRRLRASKRGDLQTSYMYLLRQFRRYSRSNLGEQCSAPQACDAASHHAEDPIGDRYIRVGDSCFSVDPLSSQGVHLALQSGLQGAIIVNTILKKPENTEAARNFFRTRVAERVGRYTRRTKQEYSRVSEMRPDSFWHERAGDASPVEAHGPSPALEPSPREPSGQLAVSPDVILEAVAV
jgi:flavin-dependent dehydrogenase